MPGNDAGAEVILAAISSVNPSDQQLLRSSLEARPPWRPAKDLDGTAPAPPLQSDAEFFKRGPSLVVRPARVCVSAQLAKAKKSSATATLTKRERPGTKNLRA